MKFQILVGLLIVLASSCTKTETIITRVTDDETPDDPISNTKWNLIFEENFDADLSKWNIWESGAFNQEIQLYQEEQLTVANGILTIEAKRESKEGATNPSDNTPKNFEYVSGRIETKDTFGPSNTEGEKELRIVARLKLPKGNGMWPAFWSFGDPWPTQGEIDILEARGNEPMSFQSNIFYGEEPNVVLTENVDTEKVYELSIDLTDDFHEYELIWSDLQLVIKFDDEILHTYNADDKNYVASLFGKKQQVVLNLAVGGVFFPGANSSNFIDDATMEVDWVRVYKK